MLDEMFQRNASKILHTDGTQNLHSFFHFSFRATLFFPIINVNIDQEKKPKYIARNEK